MRTLVSVFTGAGGLDLGLEASGFTNLLCIEKCEDACKTLIHNKPWNVISDRIENISSYKIKRTTGLKRGDLDLLAGGPPCQPFSKSGLWHTGETSGLSDPRARTIYDYFRLVEELLPKSFLIENVAGFATSSNGKSIAFIKRLLKQIENKTGETYLINWKVLNAVHFGVPQRRERLFLVGNRIKKNFNFPQETHGNEPNQLPPNTSWSFIGNLSQNISEETTSMSKWADLLPTIPEGENYLWHTERGGGRPIFEWRSRFWNFLLKLDRNQPSWTIQASPGPATGPFHWSNRKLTINELARLQTFPDEYEFYGDYKTAHRQIGNAVPPLLAEVIGKSIRKSIFEDKVWSRLKLLPDLDVKNVRKSNHKRLTAHDYRKMKTQLESAL